MCYRASAPLAWISFGRRCACPYNCSVKGMLAPPHVRFILSASERRAISSVVERLLHTQEVAGSNPASRILPMFYTYVLRCCDGHLYVGSAVDLRASRNTAQAR